MYLSIRDVIRRKVIGVEPTLPVSSENRHIQFQRLGSKYGGWTFVETSSLNNSLIVSCGLGEDASFDIEFASKYNAKIIIVDPTPRAIEHFNGIISRIGKGKESDYRQNGCESIESYDLAGLFEEQLQLCGKALWNEVSTLRFYSPPNPSHVSHSVLNFQNNYATDTPYIEVQSITIDQLMNDFNIDVIDLIKLDIEGAEIEVIIDMLQKGIYPKQFLVEYDELSKPSRRSKERIELAHNALVNSGYILLCKDGINFTYLHSPITTVN